LVNTRGQFKRLILWWSLNGGWSTIDGFNCTWRPSAKRAKTRSVDVLSTEANQLLERWVQFNNTYLRLLQSQKIFFFPSAVFAVDRLLLLHADAKVYGFFVNIFYAPCAVLSMSNILRPLCFRCRRFFSGAAVSSTPSCPSFRTWKRVASTSAPTAGDCAGQPFTHWGHSLDCRSTFDTYITSYLHMWTVLVSLLSLRDHSHSHICACHFC
jgi:hypothetical protein